MPKAREDGTLELDDFIVSSELDYNGWLMLCTEVGGDFNLDRDEMIHFIKHGIKLFNIKPEDIENA